MKKRFWKKPENIQNIIEKFLHRIGKPEQAMLIRLWQHWDMVMGADIASLTWPLGSKNNILLLGGEDSMSIQEIYYMNDEILERANAFMGQEYFTSVKARLSLDKMPLHIAVQPRLIEKPDMSSTGKVTGKYLHTMPKDSVVAQCYARYVNSHEDE